MAYDSPADSERPKYWAFISYSHRDAAAARWLHRALERYRLPTALVGSTCRDGKVPKRLYPIFRDRDELATSAHLSTAIESSLTASRNLIVVCSPQSAASAWVNEEVRRFKVLRGEDRVFCLIVDGEPGSEQECFCPALRYRLDASGQPGSEPTEPLAADLRDAGDGKRGSLLKLITGLLGLNYDQLARRDLRRRQRLLVAALAASVAVATVMTGLAVVAIRARDAARIESLKAERVKSFVVSVFEEQSPLDRGNAERMAPKQLIQNAVRRLDEELSEEPAVRAELLHTLGGIQTNLGDGAAAEPVLRRAVDERRRLFGDGSIEHAVALASLSKAVIQQGRYPEAEKLGREALAIVAPLTTAPAAQLGFVEVVAASGLSYGKGKVMEAAGLYRSAVARYELALGPGSREALYALTQLAQSHSQGNDDSAAEAAYQQVVARAEARFGKGSAWAANAQLELARLMSRKGAYQDAIALLRTAAESLLAAGVTRHEMLAAAYSNMAVTQTRTGELTEALANYDAAEAVTPSDSAKRQDNLRGRGAVLLKLGRNDEAEQSYRAAYELAKTKGGDKSAFTWYLASEWGKGLAATGRLEEAERIQREAVRQVAALMAPGAHQNALVLDNLSDTLHRQPKRRPEAVQLRLDALSIVEKRYPPGEALWREYAIALLVSAALAPDARDPALLGIAEQAVSAERSDSKASADLANALAALGLLRLRSGVGDAEAPLDEALKVAATNAHEELMAAARAALAKPRRAPR